MLDEFAAYRLVPARSRYQSAQAQRHQRAVCTASVGQGGDQPVDRGLGRSDVTLAAAGQQRLHQHLGHPFSYGKIPAVEGIIGGAAQLHDRAIEITAGGLCLGGERLKARDGVQGEMLLDAHVEELG